MNSFFSVKDNGIDMPWSFSDAFSRYPSANSGSEYPGTGIGLVICRRIVERHGGKIRAESEVGKGSMLYFTLPARKSRGQYSLNKMLLE